jgi:ELWxxDGT repeat protein
VTGRELWKSDGAEAGTVLVKDIAPGSSGSLPGYPRALVSINGTLFFSADDGVDGRELWRSDGSEAGTLLVSDIAPGAESSSPETLTDLDGTLFFSAYDGITTGLWRSDGTAIGTALVKNLSPRYSPEILRSVVDGMLFFTTYDPTCGRELWKSDGTEMGTVLVKETVRNGSSEPRLLTAANGTLFFAADDGLSGGELWASDGSETGTRLVRDVTPGSDGTYLEKLTDVEGTLFFSTETTELWKSDGTDVGTVLVKEIDQIPSGWLPGDTGPATLGGLLFFSGCSLGYLGCELWKSDGTEAGTVLVKDIAPGSASSNPVGLTPVNGTLFFGSAPFPSGTGALWKSDGTEMGTVLVKDTFPGVDDGFATSLIEVNGALYFRVCGAYSGSRRCTLWTSDGTNVGTVLVSDVGVGEAYLPAELANVGGTLFFIGDDGISGGELWKTDGAGAVLVKDIRPGSTSSRPARLTTVNGTLFFSADDGVTGRELWKSDGTEAGTVLVRDIAPGSAGSDPSELTSANGKLFFQANDRASGDELWQSDGTEAGTVLATEIIPGSGGSAPEELTAVGSSLFFSAIGEGIGRELWLLPVPEPEGVLQGVASICALGLLTRRRSRARKPRAEATPSA